MKFPPVGEDFWDKVERYQGGLVPPQPAVLLEAPSRLDRCRIDQQPVFRMQSTE
jgi:hypothetical protein